MRNNSGSETFWAIFGVLALAMMGGCVTTDKGCAAIAFSIVFATSIYGYKNHV